MTRIAVFGAGGRMGQAISGLANDSGVTIVPNSLAQVLVDFSAPIALGEHLREARNLGTPILIGTTGLDPAHHAAIDAAAREIAVLQAANTSLGVTVLAALVAEAARRLGPDWDIDVLEMHHRHKVDAPSGTALLLGQAAANARGTSLPEVSRFDREGAREEGTIGFASLRGGSVAGDHLVVFATDGERIEIGHRAESRAIFARGALRAALWLADKPPGRYTMNDVLDL